MSAPARVLWDVTDELPPEVQAAVPRGVRVSVIPLYQDSRDLSGEWRLFHRPDPVIWVTSARWSELEEIGLGDGSWLPGGHVHVQMDEITIDDPDVLRLRSSDGRAVVYRSVTSKAMVGSLLAWPD